MEYTISINPATGKEFAKFPKNNFEEIKEAIRKSRSAQKIWANLKLEERIKSVKKVQKFLIDNYEKFSKTISDDNGKLLIDSFVTEVMPAILAVDYYTHYAKNWLKPKKYKGNNILTFNKKAYKIFCPYGVIGIISPWNYPFSIPFSEVIMALLAGNGVILKTATETQAVGNVLFESFKVANLPEGLFCIVNASGPEVLKAFIEERIDKIFFTGSVETGKIIQAEASKELIPTVLELGGNDPAIILKDCDINKTCWGIIWAGFVNSGQSCGGVQRVIIDESIYDQFKIKLKEKILKLNPPTYPYNETIDNVDIGFMTIKDQKEKVIRQVIDCIEKGAKLFAISSLPQFILKNIEEKDNKTYENLKRILKFETNNILSKEDSFFLINLLLEDNSNFLPAMVLIDINEDMPIYNDEVFGPVIGLIKFKSDDIEEAIKIANNSKLGLTASIWTKNIKLAKEIAPKIEAGVIMINDHLMSHGLAHTPWGGLKYSGIGRTHGEEGFYEMVYPKIIVKDSLKFAKKMLWWHPYSKKLWDGLTGALNFLYNKSLKRKIKGIFDLIKLFSKIFED